MPSVSFLFGDCIERSLSIVDIAVSMTKQSIHFNFPTFALRGLNWEATSRLPFYIRSRAVAMALGALVQKININIYKSIN